MRRGDAGIAGPPHRASASVEYAARVAASDEQREFVSRAGVKLAHALDEFDIDVTGFVCADFGCNVGGFTDCLLQRGATRVYAIDTGYGTLAYTLRTDERVVVMERTNALHAELPSPFGRGAGGEGRATPDSHSPHPQPLSRGERGARAPGPFDGCDLVVIDMAWTPQRLAVPAARKWLKPGGRIVTLIKPHYEVTAEEKRTRLVKGKLEPAYAEVVMRRVVDSLGGVEGTTTSPVVGGKGGNVEFLALVRAPV